MSPACPGLTGLDDRCVAYRLWEMFVFSLCCPEAMIPVIFSADCIYI